MANIKDVARLAGVSISTVSRVVNNSAGVVQKKHDNVMRAMKELHYQPNTFAKALVSNKSDTIGVVVGNLAEPFFGFLMNEVENVAQEHGKQIIVSAGHLNAKKEREAIQSLINRRCDALIIHSKALTDYQLMELLENHPAAVLINREIPDISNQCIHFDNRLAGKMTVNHLLDRGHKEVAVIMSDDSKADSVDRQQGYQDALAEHGIILDKRLVASASGTPAAAYDATIRLLDQNVPFSAIFAFNGIMCAGVMKALRDRKVQIPGDVSVIGIGDGSLATYLNPILTIGHYPIQDMGRAATELAMSLCDSEIPTPEKKDFTPLICEGETVSQR